jgi:HAE1 family hydrophobic/amphiphilic exporter-1
LSQILSAQNQDIPGGQFQRQSQEYSSRVKGKFQSIDQLKNLEIPTATGTKRLDRIANIVDSGVEVKVRSTYFNGLTDSKEDNVVMLSIIKASDGNTVKMARDIRKVLPEIKEELPNNVQLDLVTDRSEFINASVEDTLTNIALGILLTALVLLFFLHDLRSTLIAALSMPFSIISTFLLLDFSGFSINIMSLMGLSTSVGILVANSIVVLENIFRHKAMGNNKREAAGKGTSEVVVAVIASAMTNIVVFVPIANMSSLIGQFFREFAMTVAYATVFSIIVSFTLTPMLASIILPEHDTKKHKIGDWLERMFKSWENSYQKILGMVIKNRLTSGITVAVSVILFFLSFFVAAQLSFEFFPATDEGIVDIELELPQGYNLNETANILEKIETKVTSHNEVKHILTQIGKINDLNQGTNLALMKIELVDVEQRVITTQEMVSALIRELSEIPNSIIRIKIGSSFQAGEAPITFYLQGNELDQLEVIKRDLYSKIKDIPGIANLNTSSRAGKPEITLTPDRIKMAEAGLTVFDLAMTLRASMEGLTTTRYSEEGEEYDIRIKLNDSSVDSPEKIGNLAVMTPTGRFKMNQLAEVKFTEGYSRILHSEKAKTIQFTAEVLPGFALGDVTSEINNEIENLQLSGGYSVKWTGEAEMMMEAMLDMGFAFLLAFLLTYMLLAAILESFTQPLMILSTIPLAMIGVFIGLYVTGLNLGVMGMLAIVMLIGIVVNNAILILDYTNVLVRKGSTVKDALLEAAPTKLKPILMSTIAIILGMAPMALGIGSAGKEFRQPIGVVSIGGLIVSGILTLYVIPAVYQLVHREKKAVEVKNEK